MVAEDDGAALESRPPTLDDLIELCRLKQTVRPKDAIDRQFLARLLEGEP